jgi:phosphoglycolate phosphatase
MATARALLFDLDGTFADTAPDLAAALNATRAAWQQPPLPFRTIRGHVSHGARALIRLGFGLQPDDPGFEERRRFLLDHYQQNICRETQLFPGIPALLDALEDQRIAWGIVTNKPSWLTEPLMTALGLRERAGCIVSGDTCARAKPYPDPIEHACRMLGVAPAEAWYVGDARRDIEAARAAGSPSIAALFGYIEADDDPQGWQADHYAETPEQLLALLGLAPHLG